MKAPGSLWVDQTTLRYVDTIGNEYYFVGTLMEGGPISDAAPASVWVDGRYVYYIDEEQNKRQVPSIFVGEVANAKPGCMWVDPTPDSTHQLSFISPPADGNPNGISRCHADDTAPQIVRWDYNRRQHLDRAHENHDDGYSDEHDDTHNDVHDDDHYDKGDWFDIQDPT